MTRAALLSVLLIVAIAASPGSPRAAATVAQVIDATTRKPIANAIVTAGGMEIRTDQDGLFRIPDPVPETIKARAYGYLRAEVAVSTLKDHNTAILLKAIRPKALYLSVFGIGDRTLRTAALKLLDTTELNALVIDVKGDRGIIPYRSSIPLAAQVGAQKIITITDLPTLLASLHERGIYAIARIVVFKDQPLASARPHLAVHRRDGSVFRDREGLSWTNPSSREVWDYNIAVASEAARAGFDEIQFDYARMPDEAGLALPQTERDREAAIDGFLSAARHALKSFNVFLAVDVFGYVCWNLGDTRIGQQIEHVMNIVDYVSPMLYPSSFQFGIPGCRNPVQHPSEIVQRSLERALERTHVPPVRFRPWLQAFRDYAFGGRPFTAGEIRAQINAAENVGTDGRMLWNPTNRYSAADLKP